MAAESLPRTPKTDAAFLGDLAKLNVQVKILIGITAS
jgi:hypothetical protein